MSDTQSSNESIEDPVELMLKKTGCIDLHYKVQVSSQMKLFCGKIESNPSKKLK